MTNDDISPATSEPNSIAPMALDTNQWKIDLHDLHAGDVRLDFSVPTFADEDADAFPKAPSRTGRRVVGVMTAMLLIAGLGFAAFRGRPALQRAYASSSASWRAPAKPATPAKPAVVAVTALQAAPTPASPPPAAEPAPAPVPVVAAPAAPAVPTFDANALPNAPKAKRGPAKTRGARGTRASK